MSRLNNRYLTTSFLAVTALLVFHHYGKAAATAVQVQFPAEDTTALLNARKQQQLKTVDQFKVFYQFQFSDKLKQSGITFVNHIVDDAAKCYQKAHYDHGTGIAVADVDGDGLDDIYFVSQTGGNELWKNLGGGKFRNITAEAGVAVPGRISVSASFADIDNDGDPDLFVTTVRGGNVLFENDGHGHFRRYQLREAGVGVVQPRIPREPCFSIMTATACWTCWSATWVNTRPTKRGSRVSSSLLRTLSQAICSRSGMSSRFCTATSDTTSFRIVTAATGLKPVGWSESGDASFADLNDDGWPDVYFLNMMGANHYYENDHGKFTEQTKKYFPRTSWGAMGIKFFDYDNDGRMDLFVTDMHSDMYAEVGPADEKKKNAGHSPENFLMGPASSFVFGNSLYHNLGAGKFEGGSRTAWGRENYWPWGPSTGDLNADGWEDIFIASSMNFPFRYGINSLLLNNRGEKFLDAEFLTGVEPRRTGGHTLPGSKWIARSLREIPKRIFRIRVRDKPERSR